MEKMDIEKLLAEGKIIQIKPQGYSMYPLFVPGRDEAIIEQVNPASLKRGDIVLYRRKTGILVLHRIWKRTDQGFFTVGDNQTEIEGPLGDEQIKGKMTGCIRNGKKIPVTNTCYRMFSGLWLWIRPFRPYIANMIHWIKTK